MACTPRLLAVVLLTAVLGLEEVQLVWLRVLMASWHLPQGYGGAPFQLPVIHWGSPPGHQTVGPMTALANHREQCASCTAALL